MAKHFHYPVLLENSHAEPGFVTNNMIFPGPDIGGYCLPKDGGLNHLKVKTCSRCPATQVTGTAGTTFEIKQPGLPGARAQVKRKPHNNSPDRRFGSYPF
jgi:hypothetical protein